MEPAKDSMRLRLVLGKFQVSKVDKGLAGLAMTIDLGGGVKIRCDIPVSADVRVGDLLTFYTEVLADLSNPNPMTPN